MNNKLISQIDEYFSSVTPEQLLADLQAANFGSFSRDGVSVDRLGGNEIRIVISLSSFPPRMKSFSTDNEYRNLDFGSLQAA